MLHWNLECEPCFRCTALLSRFLLPNHSSHYDTVQMILIFTPKTFERENPWTRQTREEEGGKGRRIPLRRASINERNTLKQH